MFAQLYTFYQYVTYFISNKQFLSNSIIAFCHSKNNISRVTKKIEMAKNIAISHMVTLTLIGFLVASSFSSKDSTVYEINPFSLRSDETSKLQFVANSNLNFSKGLTFCLKVKFYYRNMVRIIHSDLLKLDLEDFRWEIIDFIFITFYTALKILFC